MSYDDFLRAQADRRVEMDAAQLLEFTLWRVTKGGQVALARTRRQPSGIELCIVLGDEIIWARMFQAGQTEQLRSENARKRDEFLRAGWSPAAT